MKIFRLVIFLSIFFLLYALINYYLYSNGMQALGNFAPSVLIDGYQIFFLFLVLAYPVARIAGRWMPGKMADFLSFIGGMWFAAILYFTIFVLLIDILGWGLSFIPAWNVWLSENKAALSVFLFTIIVVANVLLIVYGYINAMNPRISKISLSIKKPVAKLQKLRIVFASDLHLGHLIGKKYLSKLIQKINDLKPDLVLFPGDIVDEDLKPVIEKKLGEQFELLHPKYGVFAVTGNHEYIGGAEEAVRYLSNYGIRFLRDEAVLIDGKFWLVGREDISTNTFFNKKRKPLNAILEHINKELPVLLMDHQPIAFSEAVDAIVDLQISGHTHHGQMWPLQAITQRVFKLSWGYRKFGDTHFYVSSGAGTWGPRVRIGNRPEIVLIEISFAP